MYINSNLEQKVVKIHPKIIVNDGCSFVFQHHPFSLVATQTYDGVSELYSIDLFSFSQKCLVKYKPSDPTKTNLFKRVCVIHNKVFIAVDGIGVLTYKLPSFK